MKKITLTLPLILILCMLSFNFKTHAQDTFNFDSGSDNGNNITQTVSGITVTVTNIAVGVDFASGTHVGGSGLSAVLSTSTLTPTTITFSAPVDITSIFIGDNTQGFFFTPVNISANHCSGNPTAQQSAFDHSRGSNVMLNWTKVTSFTIASSDSREHLWPVIDNIVFTAATPNNAPALGGTPADGTATEDIATAIDLSAYNVADADDDNITLTLAVNKGTIAATDGNGTTADVTVATSGTSSMTLSGTAANLNTYLDDTSKIEFTTDLNDTSSVTLTVTPNDRCEDGAADTVTINITAVNDAPTVAINTGISLNEGGTEVIDNMELNEGDPDDSGTGLTYTVTTLPDHGILQLSAMDLAKDDTFTQDDIDNDRIQYVHDGSETTSDSFIFRLADGGEDGVSAVTDQTFNITIAPVNDEPTLTATGSNPTFTVGGSAVLLFSSASASTVESGQDFSEIVFRVTNVNDVSDEIINFDGSALTLDNLSGTTANNALSYSVNLEGSTGVVRFFGATLSALVLQTLIDNMSYQNNSSSPNTSDRVVTIVFLRDTGGTDNMGDDNADLSIASTVSVNVAPTLTLDMGVATHTEGAGTTYISPNANLTDSDDNWDGGTLTVRISENAESTDRLNVANTFSISSSSTSMTIFSSGSDIATANATSVTSNETMTITFNKPFVSSSIVENVIRALAFETTSDSPSSTPRTIEIVATDNAGASVMQTRTMNVTATNDVPTDISLSNASIEENNAEEDIIGTFSTTDPDEDTNFIYALVAGSGDTDNDSFYLVGNELQAAEVFDFDSKSSYSIRVQTDDDNGGIFEKMFTITIDKTLAIDENLLKELKIYPNPTTDKLMVRIEKNESDTQIKLLTVGGIELMTFDANEEVSLSHLPTGLYILSVSDDQNTGTYKIIKK